MQDNWFKTSLSVRKHEKQKSFFGHLYLLKKAQLLVKNEFFHLDFDFTMQLGNKKVTFFTLFFLVFDVLTALEFLDI